MSGSKRAKILFSEAEPRYCEWCGKKLERKCYGMASRPESTVEYNKRRFCNNTCSGLWTFEFRRRKQ